MPQRVVSAKSAPFSHFWSSVESATGEFTNPKYDPGHKNPLAPPQIARTWTGYLNRWVDDPIRGEGLKPVDAAHAPPAYEGRPTLESALRVKSLEVTAPHARSCCGHTCREY